MESIKQRICFTPSSHEKNITLGIICINCYPNCILSREICSIYIFQFLTLRTTMIKKFIIKLFLFSIITCLLIYFTGEILYIIINKTGNNILSDTDFKVTEAVCRSRKHIKTRKLVLGDSVGDSLYGNSTDSCVYSLTATVAITTVGQYCLLANFLDNNKEEYPQEVIVIINPICWNNILSGGLSYSLFAKQFYNNEFKPYLDKNEIDLIAEWPLASLLNQKWFRICPYTVDVKSDSNQGKWISEIQYRYLHKMLSLCQSKGIKFRLLSGPVRQSLHKKIEIISKADEKTKEPIFIEYFKSIKYLPDSYFADQLHLKTHNIPTDYFNLYKQ